jgi:hypothetical protein
MLLPSLPKPLQATARCPNHTTRQVHVRELGAGYVHGLEPLTQAHRSAQFAVLTAESFALLFIQVPSVAAQAPPAAALDVCPLA